MEISNKMNVVDVSLIKKKLYKFVVTAAFPKFVQFRYIGKIEYHLEEDEIFFVPSGFSLGTRQSSINSIAQEMKKMRVKLNESKEHDY